MYNVIIPESNNNVNNFFELFRLQFVILTKAKKGSADMRLRCLSKEKIKFPAGKFRQLFSWSPSPPGPCPFPP